MHDDIPAIYPYKRLTIKDLAEDDRPREKMLRKGVAALSDAELLAILLRSGSADSTAVDVAQQILGLAHNNLDELGRLSVNQLTKLKGVGQTKAITVLAALELGRRRGVAAPTERPVIRCSLDIIELMRPKLADLRHEEFWVLLLNKANRLTDMVQVSKGGLAHTVVDVRLIMEPAIAQLSAGIALAHNHPSGDPMPSSSDKLHTEQVRKAAKLFNITLIDHVIITSNRCFSFIDEGLL